MYNLDKRKGNTDLLGRYFWRIEDREQKDETEKCFTWVSIQDDVNFRSWYNKDIRSDRRMACPCTLSQAWLDRGRFVRDRSHPWPSLCFRSRHFKYFSYDGDDLSNVRFRMSKLCCYSAAVRNEFGSLKTGPPDGSRIIADPFYQFYNWKNNEREIYTDIQAHKFCCVDTKLCDLFYLYRPTDDCSLYRPPRKRTFVVVTYSSHLRFRVPLLRFVYIDYKT